MKMMNNMKKLFLFIFAGLLSMSANAQETKPKNLDDADRIQLSTYLEQSRNIPQKSRKTLSNLLNKVVTKNGMGSTQNSRFIVTCNVVETYLEKTNTAPVMFAVGLEVTFYIGDGIDGTLYSSTSISAEGLDDSKDMAYMAALQTIKANNPAFKAFIEEGKQKIVDYYASKCDFIITQAQTKAKNQDFDGALYDLMQVPDVCKECFDKCMAAAQPIYQEKINQEGAALLAEARNVWSAGLDYAAAEAATAILSQINPQSTSFAAAEKLSADIAKRVKEIDQREWNFTLKQQQDEVDLEKASIKAMRDIGVAYGENQQPTTYNVIWW